MPKMSEYNPAPATLYVDSTTFTPHCFGGIDRVIYKILRGFLRSQQNHFRIEPVSCLGHELGYYPDPRVTNSMLKRGILNGKELTLLKNKGIENGQLSPALKAQLRIEPQAGDVFFALGLHSHITQEKLLQSWREKGVRVYCIAYDFLPLIYPQLAPPYVHEAHLAWAKLVFALDGLLCISQTVAAQCYEICQSHNLVLRPDFQIMWTHLGVDDEPPPLPPLRNAENDRAFLDWVRRAPTLITVASIEPRKGLSEILDALEILWRSGTHIQWLLVGKNLWLMDQFIHRVRQHPEWQRRLLIDESASDEQLQSYYRNGTALLANNLDEGFGLPLIEAAYRGLPVIAKSSPIFHEVMEEHASFYDNPTQDPLILAQHLHQWLQDYAQQNHLPSSGLAVLNWDQVADNMLTLLHQATHAQAKHTQTKYQPHP